MHGEELPVHRFVLIHGREAAGLARQIKEDISEASPVTDVEFHRMEFTNAWDFEEVFSNLLDFTRAFPFDPDAEEYYVHLTTGTHVAQICLFLLTEARYFPAKFVQSSPDPNPPLAKGALQIVDLDLSKYDSIARRFAEERRDRYAALKSGINTHNQRFNSMIESADVADGTDGSGQIAAGTPHF
jgi:transcriptional regulatory protein RtcR